MRNSMELLNKETSVVLDNDSEKYDVSICIVAYNAEKYINDAISGIFLQKTTLDYEIVIGEDCSKDSTADILRSMWEKDKHRFSIILNKKNLGLSSNMFNVLERAKGKYAIVLYGDDYWIDDSLLQSQFEFLENNHNYIAVTSPLKFIYDGETDAFRTGPARFLWGKRMTLNMYLKGYNLPMAGVMFRHKMFVDNSDHFFKMVESCNSIDDITFPILLLMLGDAYIIDKPMGAYRCFKKESGANNFNSVNTNYRINMRTVQGFNNLYNLTDRKLDLSIRYGLALASSFNSLLHNRTTKKEYKEIVNAIGEPYRRHLYKIWFLGMVKKIELAVRG